MHYTFIQALWPTHWHPVQPHCHLWGNVRLTQQQSVQPHCHLWAVGNGEFNAGSQTYPSAASSAPMSPVVNGKLYAVFAIAPLLLPSDFWLSLMTYFIHSGYQLPVSPPTPIQCAAAAPLGMPYGTFLVVSVALPYFEKTCCDLLMDFKHLFSSFSGSCGFYVRVWQVASAAGPSWWE